MQNAKFQEFPKRMVHPAHSPATYVTAPGKGTGLFAPETTIKTVEKFPDVTVVDERQEALMASKGYRPVNSGLSEKDYQAAVLQQVMPEHAFQKFPKWKYHAFEASCIVKSQEEEDALGDDWKDAPVIATEDDDIPEMTVAPERTARALTPKQKKARHKRKAAKKKVSLPVVQAPPA
jgi:hypothetical protein